MFALNLMARASEVDGSSASAVGWIVIAIAWSIIGALWMAGSVLTQRASQSNGLAPDRKAPEARTGVELERKHCNYHCYLRLLDLSER